MKRTPHIYSVQIIACVMLSCLTACSTRKNIEPGEVPPPPPQIDRSSVAETFQAVAESAHEEGTILVHTGTMYSRVKSIIDKIARAAQLGTTYPYPLYIAENEDPELINAYVANGNIVVVYSGLVEKVKSDGQLAAILGHEIAHMLARHHEDDTAEKRETAVSVASGILGTVAGVATAYATGSSSAGDLAGDLTSDTSEAIGTGAFVRSYDRDMEREADSIGLVLMAKAGYNPQEAIDFWKNADAIFGHTPGLAFFSTHPSHGDRAAELETQLPIAIKFYKR